MVTSLTSFACGGVSTGSNKTHQEDPNDPS
jgi:hypothetical protein